MVQKAIEESGENGRKYVIKNAGQNSENLQKSKKNHRKR
jgi:hypothetical protein